MLVLNRQLQLKMGCISLLTGIGISTEFEKNNARIWQYSDLCQILILRLLNFASIGFIIIALFKEYKLSQPEPEILRREIADDEIDLVELFLILWKRKWMIVIVILLVTVTAAGISFLMPKVYEVTAIIEPGKDAEGQIITTPQAIRENIVGGAYDQKIAEKLGLTLDTVSRFKASVPKQTDLVKISIDSTEPQQATQILQELLVNITADIQEKLNIEIKKSQNEIKKIQMKDGFLLANINLLKEQIAQIKVKMAELEKDRKTATASPKGDAMAVLLYSNEIQDQQVYINDLQEKLTNTLNQRSQLKLDIANVQLKLSAIKGTNISKRPSSSDKPIKPKKTLIVALAFVLGFMGSVMLAFFAEFMAKVRREQKAVE